jgi:L-2-hydroxyglutarate oxidase LhgO
MYDYCNKHQIPYRRCGKIIVAVDESEVPRLKDLYERGIKNGVRDITLIDREKMKEIEPNCEVSLDPLVATLCGVVYEHCCVTGCDGHPLPVYRDSGLQEGGIVLC